MVVFVCGPTVAVWRCIWLLCEVWGVGCGKGWCVERKDHRTHL